MEYFRLNNENLGNSIFFGPDMYPHLGVYGQNGGHQVVVIDDRQEFANSVRFSGADEVMACPFSEPFGQISVTGWTYIAITTRGHVHDRDVLRAALQTGAAYICMIVSRRKREVIYRTLKEEGVANEIPDRVHSPIGLDIGAESQEEIAVSIIAELRAPRIFARK